MPNVSLPTIETIVTYMELRAIALQSESLPDGLTVHCMMEPDYELYISLYRRIGCDHIWNYRPGQSAAEVMSVLRSDTSQIMILRRNDIPIGMAELDMSDGEVVEIVHFGLLPEATGQGIGGFFLQLVLEWIWRRGAGMVRLSTSGLDHPQAIRFYQRYGFRITRQRQAQFIDFRYSGFYALTDAPRIPHGAAFFNGQRSGIEAELALVAAASH